MRRREFVAGVGASAVVGSRGAWGQRDAKRVGVLIGLAESDPQTPIRVAVIRDGLRELGWIEGRNLELNLRFGAVGADPLQRQASELVDLKPNVIFAGNTSALAALHRETRVIPIVFAQVDDPVGGGFVASLARPGGNVTGFGMFEEATAVKWLELLKQIAPTITRVGFIFDPANPVWKGFYRRVEEQGLTLGVAVSSLPVRDRNEIERALDTFAQEPKGGLIVFAGPATAIHRDQVIASAARHGLPTVYPYRYFVSAGGLASYGVDNIDLYRRATFYIDRVLKGENTAQLPVQQATKFELAINLKTAKALGLEVPMALLARTDEVIDE